MQQQTLAKRIAYVGREYCGNQWVSVALNPAEPNTGYVFGTPEGYVQANLENARQYKASILITDGRARVLNVEHILATLFACGVDNAYIEVHRMKTPAWNFCSAFGLTTNIQIIPTAIERERSLTRKIMEGGVKTQDVARKLLTPADEITDGKLTMYPEDIDGVIVRAHTDYPLPGKESVLFHITPEIYLRELAHCRPFAKHIPPWMSRKMLNTLATVTNPRFGLDHNISEHMFFFPKETLGEWQANERAPAELARHTIVDRLGAIALLPGRLHNTYVIANGSGHANDIKFLQDNLRSFEVKE